MLKYILYFIDFMGKAKTLPLTKTKKGGSANGKG